MYLHIQTRALERMLRCPEERSPFPRRQENVQLEYLAKCTQAHSGKGEFMYFVLIEDR